MVNVMQITLFPVYQYIGRAICFYFIYQTCVLYSAFDKCFYICGVVVVKSVYITFLVHKEQFAFPL